VLKSTLTPDIVHDLYIKYGKDAVMAKYGKLRYIYSPEFLREASWEKDALNPVLMIMAGSFSDCTELQTIYKRHSNVQSYIRYYIVDYKVAALAKYAINSFLANKVVFMNQLYQLYSDMYDSTPVRQEEWKEFTDMLTADIRMGHTHMQVPGVNNVFGYGGTCFPKDVKALIGFDKEGRLTVLRETELVNTQIRLSGKQ
jgi:UDPglucose 6-dehydrogenase